MGSFVGHHPAAPAEVHMQHRSGVKVVANVKFPEFREEDRKDMAQFVTELNRVASHAAGGGVLSLQEWISMMLNACGRTATAGPQRPVIADRVQEGTGAPPPAVLHSTRAEGKGRFAPSAVEDRDC